MKRSSTFVTFSETSLKDPFPLTPCIGILSMYNFVFMFNVDGVGGKCKSFSGKWRKGVTGEKKVYTAEEEYNID